MKIWRSFKSYQAVDGDGDSKTEQFESSKTETESLKITKLCKDPRDAPILCKKLRKLIKNKALSEKIITSALLTAVCNGNLIAFTLMIEEYNFDMNVLNMLACMNGHESLLQYINKSVPSILNYNTPGGINILHIAAAKGHFGCFTYLLQDAQLDPSVTTKDDLTCLHFASAYDNVDIVKYLLDLKSEICITKDGHIPLHYACFEGCDMTTEYLLKSSQGETMLSMTDIGGHTCAHLAAARGHCSTLQILLNRELSPDVCSISWVYSRSENGMNILHYACKGHVEAVKVILRSVPNLEPLLCARDNMGNNCLHICAKHGQNEIISLLLQHSCSRNMLEERNEEESLTPFLVAVKANKLNTIKFLIERISVNKYASTKKGENALHICCRFGDWKTVQYLVDSSLDPLCRATGDGSNSIPLYVSCVYGRLEIVQFLLHRHGDSRYHINEDNGWTLLIAACSHGHLEVALYLLMHSFLNPTTKDKTGKTALHWACQNGHASVVQMLLKFPSKEDLLSILDETDNVPEAYCRDPLTLQVISNHKSHRGNGKKKNVNKTLQRELEMMDISKSNETDSSSMDFSNSGPDNPLLHKHKIF